MPKQVDHERRRRRVIEAVYALADEHGLEGVTLRDVARQAGMSMGAVQRSFRTKDEMLALALAHVSEAFAARVRAAADEPSPPAPALARVAGDLALLGAERRPEAQVWLAFVARAAVTPAMAGILRDGYPAVQGLLAGLVREAAGTAVDAELEARTLLALADGLTVQVLLGQLGQDEARRILDAHVDGLCGSAAGDRPRKGPAVPS
ncbi:TetR family transcriptional regulator [Streptomyces sp. SCUT-3]|uniref:TetR/AcrR family transcriptional regulator n=1 Tax=Streptomyces TaxID=1883 RepID=UPI0015F80317|nr:TetR family transcriptional regulator C-terminal domain-containing protein [Streptomyces sp. SCUT-3]QMV21351.1 TetR family transcriptional regulator [Streptomyces sp. SCUT-3]